MRHEITIAVLVMIVLAIVLASVHHYRYNGAQVFIPRTCYAIQPEFITEAIQEKLNSKHRKKYIQSLIPHILHYGTRKAHVIGLFLQRQYEISGEVTLPQGFQRDTRYMAVLVGDAPLTLTIYWKQKTLRIRQKEVPPRSLCFFTSNFVTACSSDESYLVFEFSMYPFRRKLYKQKHDDERIRKKWKKAKLRLDANIS